MPKPAKPLRVAVDTGGTFTDCVWQNAAGGLQLLKVPSTPHDPALAIANALRQVAGDREVLLLHGTTVGTNAVIERRGARVAFITTKGFEDTLSIGRQARPKLYDLSFDKIAPLVDPENCLGVGERISKDGEVLVALKSEEMDRLLKRLRRAEAIAVSLLFSFANPVHEKQIESALRGLGVPVSLSHRLLPEFREYERASTTVMNAYLQPVTSRYLHRLRERVGGRIFLMQSNGGLASLRRAEEEPVRTVLSGPAGGVIGATRVANASGIRRIIGLDMGGTSTDVWLVEDEPHTTSEAEVAGLPVRVPMLNIHTIGAGGGSFAWFDPGGALRVGPESAGAEPGPICYGKGDNPTVTDCNLLLGRLPQRVKLAATRSLDLERTVEFTRRWLQVQKQKMAVERFAEGVLRVVNSNMEKAVRLVSIEKGHDPRFFTLVAFGGAGALHACQLAEALEIPHVLVPYMPGALSALGILLSDVVRDYSRTLLLPPAELLPYQRLQAEIGRMSSQAEHELRQEGWKGKIQCQSSIDLRYAGQGFEITVPFATSSLDRFAAEHERMYGFRFQRPIEVVTVRLRARIAQKNLGGRPSRPAMHTKRPAKTRVRYQGRTFSASLLERDSFKQVAGPAIIIEYSATTFLPPGWQARRDQAGNLHLRKK